MKELENFIYLTASQIKNNNLNFGYYAPSLGMLMSVWISLLCEKRRVTFVELGVSNGKGLFTMIEFAKYISSKQDIEIDIVGFDIGTGMPTPVDYRDHPELWKTGDFSCETDTLIEKIGNNATFVLGDVQQTVPEFCKQFKGTVAYISLDLDYYSSTVASFPLFNLPAENLLPAVCMHVDDIHTNLLFNPWCGESLAINEFNTLNKYRKIHEKSVIYNIPNFHVLHVFDHPLLEPGKLKYPINCGPFN
jgi:hypothetical protein